MKQTFEVKFFTNNGHSGTRKYLATGKERAAMDAERDLQDKTLLKLTDSIFIENEIYLKTNAIEGFIVLELPLTENKE